MAYSRHLTFMTFMDDFHGWLSWMTFKDDFHGWLSWRTLMDDKNIYDILIKILGVDFYLDIFLDA